MGILVLVQQMLGPMEYRLAGFAQIDGTGPLDEINPEREQQRLTGPIGEPNRFAQVLAVLIPLAAGLAIAAPARRRWLYWLAILLLFAGVALSFSRGAIVAMVLVTPIALLFGVLRLRHLVLAAFCGAVLIAALPSFAQRAATIGQVALQSVGLLPGGFRNADGASRGRVTEMKAAGLLFLDHPLLGAGPGMTPEYYAEYAKLVGGKVRTQERRAHNLYLELAAETGVVGLLAFLCMLWMVIHVLDDARRWTVYSDRELWGLLCGLELGVLVHMVTSLFLHASYIRYFWLLLALAVAAAALPRRQPQAEFLHGMMRNAPGRLERDTTTMAVAQPLAGIGGS
jgi:putative inorganic carbon (hco3(-)) transporter